MYLVAHDRITSDRLAIYITDGQHQGSWEVTVTNDPKYFSVTAPVICLETSNETIYVAIRRTYLTPSQIKQHLAAMCFSLETRWANIAISGPNQISID